MKQRIVQIALLVKDYDEAIKFYTEKLNFTLTEDTILSETKRWVRIAPKGSTEFVCCWQRLIVKNNKPELEIKPAGGFFNFFTPTIFGEIIKICWLKKFYL